MLSESIYYVYFNENFENPINPNNKNGELIFDTGIIPVLQKGDSATLTFESGESELRNGSYKIVAFQSDDHPGNKKLGGEVVDRMPVFGTKIDVKSCETLTDSNDTEEKDKENEDLEEGEKDSNKDEIQDDQSIEKDSIEEETQESEESNKSGSEDTQETTQNSSENAESDFESSSTEHNNVDVSTETNETFGGESNE
ncbi:hypothetical protein [Sutcliffiella horikoshii]|uniref:hypothetical protein n=1 Tax=Sutcliffiella horikoshii TaxID=79883 RepID=UPI001F38D54A|nr:hypothetical protein [Sutcliffiella horikoshii]MCG1021656.1 hypothetical protein [Sutcliffiella horikoshii]